MAREHRSPLAIDDGVAAPSLDDEAKRRAGMAMRSSDLARHHDLNVGDQRVAGYAGQLGVGKAQHPALRLRGAYQLGRPHRLRPQIAPVPEEWHRLALRLDTDAAADPGRCDVLRAQLRVVAIQLFRRGLDVGKLQHLKILPLVRAKRGPRALPPAALASPELSADHWPDGARGFRYTPFHQTSETASGRGSHPGLLDKAFGCRVDIPALASAWGMEVERRAA